MTATARTPSRRSLEDPGCTTIREVLARIGDKWSVFVITLLGVDQHEKLDEPRKFQRPVALGLGVLLFALIVAIAQNDWVTGARSTIGPLEGSRQGNVRNLARTLFTDYVWAFEITAVLLVIAVVGGVVLARRSGHRPTADRGHEE